MHISRHFQTSIIASLGPALTSSADFRVMYVMIAHRRSGSILISSISPYA